LKCVCIYRYGMVRMVGLRGGRGGRGRQEDHDDDELEDELEESGSSFEQVYKYMGTVVNLYG